MASKGISISESVKVIQTATRMRTEFDYDSNRSPFPEGA